jgi:hypothetical protein
MRNRLSVAVASFSFLAATSPARAEKLEGILWDVGPRVILEGVEVMILDQTRIERMGHPGITARELRIGWEVETASAIGKARSKHSRRTSKWPRAPPTSRRSADTSGISPTKGGEFPSRAEGGAAPNSEDP